MTNYFKVGDVCIGQNLFISQEYNGMECVVTGGLAIRAGYSASTGKDIGDILCYRVKWADGTESAQRPHELRLKRPPRRDIDEVVNWESVGWMPMDVKLGKAIKQAMRDKMRERA